MKILLIAGHGAGDPGACGNGYQEATLVRELAPKLKDTLSDYADVTIFEPNMNMYKYLKSGTFFDFKKYDYVFEWHFNACVNDKVGDGKTTGTEILVHGLESGTHVEECIVKNIAALGFRNRGVKRRTDLQNMNICRRVQNVSYALLETCFIDDKDDMDLYVAKKNDVVKAVADGIIKGFGLKKKAVVGTMNALVEDLEVLAMNGVINSPAYWQNNALTIKYLPELIHNMANKLR